MNYYKRENYLRKIRGFYEDTGLIKVITGVRRCGKSCLMGTIAEEMRERGTDDAHIVYIDLDSRPYKNITTPDQLERIIDEKTPSPGTTYLEPYFREQNPPLLPLRYGIRRQIGRAHV